MFGGGRSAPTRRESLKAEGPPVGIPAGLGARAAELHLGLLRALRLGLDGSTDPQFGSRSDLDLSPGRVGAVRDALIRAGTPAYKIETGAFGDPQDRRAGEVEVLLISAR